MFLSTFDKMTFNAFKAWMLTDDAADVIEEMRNRYEMTCSLLEDWLKREDSLKRRERIAKDCLSIVNADEQMRGYRIFVEEIGGTNYRGIGVHYLGFNHRKVSWNQGRLEVKLDPGYGAERLEFGCLREDFPHLSPLGEYQAPNDNDEVVRTLFSSFLESIRRFRDEPWGDGCQAVRSYSELMLYLESLPCSFGRQIKEERWFVISYTPCVEQLYHLNYLPWAFKTSKRAKRAIEEIGEYIVPPDWDRYKVLISDGMATITRLQTGTATPAMHRRGMIQRQGTEVHAPTQAHVEQEMEVIKLQVEQIRVPRNRMIPTLNKPLVWDWKAVRTKNWHVRTLNMEEWLEKLDSRTFPGTGEERSAESDRFARLCDWWKFDLTRLESWQWPLVLRHRPDLAEHCQCWGEWGDDMWCVLLRRQPQFADRFHRFDEISADLWSFLLRKQPHFSEKFNRWDEVCSYNWVKLLKDQPQFASHCVWEKLGGYEWTMLLKGRPEFAPNCCWERLDGDDWEELLECCPEFASHCDWGKLNSLDWKKLLIARSEFASCCDKWMSFAADEWCELLKSCPEFQDKCDWEHFHWDEVSEERWVQLIECQPSFLEKAESSAAVWRKISAANWVKILTGHPDLRATCEVQFSRWENLSVQGFLELSSLAPGLAGHCDWLHQWTADEQVKILVSQPEFASHVRFETFTSGNWRTVLEKIPELADRCDWNVFSEEELVSLVKCRRNLIGFVPRGRIVSRRSWIDLSKQDDACRQRFLQELNVNALDGRAITDILLELPELLEYLPTDRITDEIDKKRLMLLQRELAEKIFEGEEVVDCWSNSFKWKGRDGIVLGVCVKGDLPALTQTIGPCDAIVVMRTRVRCRKKSKRISDVCEQWRNQYPNIPLIQVKIPHSQGEELMIGLDRVPSLDRAFSILSESGRRPRSVAIIGYAYDISRWFEKNGSSISVVYLVN